MDLLFDLYGTLIDIHTDEEKIAFWKKFARKTKKYAGYKPLELKENYLKLCSIYQEEVEEINIISVFKDLFFADEATANKIAVIFRKASTKYIRLYKNAKEMLIRLKDLGFRIHLLSNAQAAFTIPEMKKLGIYDLFDNICISSDYKVKKPNEAFFLKVMKKLNINPKKAIMIGNDFECDIKPAKALGLKTIFIESNLTPSHNEKDFVKGFDKDIIINKIKEKCGI